MQLLKPTPDPRRAASRSRGPEPKTVPAVVCLTALLCGMTPTVRAQALADSLRSERTMQAVPVHKFVCVDATGAHAHRHLQDAPCRWPMVELPPAAAASTIEPARRTMAPSKPTGADGGHAMFWRFPVQPLGPYEAPRHSWR